MLEPISNSPQSNDPDDEGRHWDAALLVLQKIDPDLVLTHLTGWDWLKARLYFLRSTFGFDASLNQWLKNVKRDDQEVLEGVSVPLKSKHGESRAFELQVRVLEYAIQLRKAIYNKRRQLTLEQLPHDQENEQSRTMRAKSEAGKTANTVKSGSSPDSNIQSAPMAGNTVRTFIAEIEKDEIPSPAMKDIVADYWNKLALVAWEKATLSDTAQSRAWLQQARTYMDIALQDRPNWIPGQLTRARIEGAEGHKDEALKALERVLGKKRVAIPTTAVTSTPSADSQGIVTLIQSMNLERDAKVIASLILRSFGTLSQQTIREVTVGLAGKIDAQFLDQIFNALPQPAKKP